MVETKKEDSNKIRILFLSANPKGTKKLDLVKEFNAIQEIIDSEGSREQFSLEPRLEASVSKIQQYLIKYNPQIVHFAGHGDDSVETGILLFQDSEAKKEPASKESIADLFRILNGRKNIREKNKIRLVVLNACFSQELADELSKYVECVIGMYNQVNDIAARIFAESFYQGIASGQSVHTAFKLGRSQLELLNIPKEHMIPGIAIRKGADPSGVILVRKKTNSSGKRNRNTKNGVTVIADTIEKTGRVTGWDIGEYIGDPSRLSSLTAVVRGRDIKGKMTGGKIKKVKQQRKDIQSKSKRSGDEE